MGDIIYGQSHMKTWKIKHSKRGKKHISENVVGTLVIEKIAGKELTSKCFKSIGDWLPLLILFFFWKLLYHVCCRCFCSHAYFLTKKASSGQVEAPYIIELKNTKKVHFHLRKAHFFLRRLELTFFWRNISNIASQMNKK